MDAAPKNGHVTQRTMWGVAAGAAVPAAGALGWMVSTLLGFDERLTRVETRVEHYAEEIREANSVIETRLDEVLAELRKR